MNFFSIFWNSCKDLFFWKEKNRVLQQELQFHLEMQTEEFCRAGMSEPAARRAALIKLGQTTRIQEEVASQNPLFPLEDFYKDAKYGFRSLKKSPGFTLVAILSLALSIGGCTALFSLLHGILLRPLPFPDPDQLVEIHDRNGELGLEKNGVSAPLVEDWRRLVSGLEGVSAFFTMGRTLSGDGDSEVVLATQVTADFFHIFRIQPLLGRTFTAEETARTQYNSANGVATSDPLVVLSHGLWSRRFGSDPQIIGKTVTLDRRLWKVIGVMPSHFDMPSSPALWIPWGMKPNHARDQRFAKCVARLKSGKTAQQVEAEINAVTQRLALNEPESRGWESRVTPLQEAMTGDVKGILWVLLTAVALVVIIACANIAVLQLSRTSARLQESYIRLALGAGRMRLIRQFFIESALIAAVGGIFGVLIAYWGIEWLQRVQPNLPRLKEISLNNSVLLWSFTLTAFTTLLFGLGPAVVGVGNSRTPLTGADGLRSTVDASGQRFRNTLVVLEIALAFVLLTSSVMLIRSFARLRSVDPGFNPRNVLVAPIFLDMEKYGSGSKTRNYYKLLFEKLLSVPGVKSAGAATALPASPLGADFKRPVWDSRSANINSWKRFADVRMVTTDYFRTMGMRILEGRGFSSLDSPDAPGVVMVNELLARQIWPKGDAIGKELVVDYSTSGTYGYQVIGVVKNVRFHGLRSVPRPEIYFPHAQRSYLVLNVAIRTTVDPRLLIPEVRKVLLQLDPEKPPHNLTALEDLVDATVMRDRYAMMLVTSFAAVAFVLALLGIYGVLAYYVRQRVREIGIRMAIGAKQGQIVRWITGQGIRLLLAGLVIGLIAAAGFARLLASLLYEVSPLDLFSYTAAIFCLCATAILASWLPARRASKINPNLALRYE
jgi:predicted permease